MDRLEVEARQWKPVTDDQDEFFLKNLVSTHRLSAMPTSLRSQISLYSFLLMSPLNACFNPFLLPAFLSKLALCKEEMSILLL